MMGTSNFRYAMLVPVVCHNSVSKLTVRIWSYLLPYNKLSYTSKRQFKYIYISTYGGTRWAKAKSFDLNIPGVIGLQCKCSLQAL